MRQLAAAAAVVLLLVTTAGAAAGPAPLEFVISWSGSGSADELSLDTMTLQPLLPNGAMNVSFSADGTHMTYEQDGLVMVADGNGSNPRIVNTMGLHPYTGSSLSPDAAYVVFGSDGGHLYVATVNSQDGEVHQITGSTQIDERPAWSPRGDAIVFTRLSDAGRPELWIVGPTGGDRQLTFGGVNTYSSAPAWSPDGTSIAFNQETYLGNHVSIMNADGSDAHAITPEFPRPFGYAEPAWSPDGQRVAFAESPTRLDVIGVNRQNWSQLHDGGPNEIARVAWRPHGAGLAAAFGDLDSPVPRRNVTITGEVRSLGDQPATSVAVSVTASSARIASMSIGTTTCAGTCTIASIPGDTTLPVKIVLVPLRTGALTVNMTATAANDAIHSDDATTTSTSTSTSVSACTILGTAGNDRLRARGGDYVCASDGDDVIHARNGKPDTIDGGPGNDTAIVDRFDTVRRVEHVRRR